MTKFNQIDFKRVAVSTLGAIILSAACVAGAVAPANAAAPATVADWQKQVSARIESSNDVYSRAMPVGEDADAVLAVRFTADGDFAGAQVARSSGQSDLDDHALSVARHLRYPALPAALKGRPQTVAMRILFGRAANEADAQAMRDSVRSTTIYADAGKGGGDKIAVK